MEEKGTKPDHCTSCGVKTQFLKRMIVRPTKVLLLCPACYRKIDAFNGGWEHFKSYR